MSTSSKKIYSGQTLNGELTITDSFKYSSIVYIIPNGLSQKEGYEIAASLIIELVVTEDFAGVPITTDYGEKEISLEGNFFDTGYILVIPNEVVKQGLSLRVIFATSYSINIDVYAIQFSEISNNDLNIRLDEILQSISTSNAQNNVELAVDILQTIGLAALTGGIFPAVVTNLISGDTKALLPGVIQGLL